MPDDELVRAAVTAGFDLWVVQHPHGWLPQGMRTERVLVGNPAAAADGELYRLVTLLVRRYGIGQILCGPGADGAVRAVVRRVRRERPELWWRDPVEDRLTGPASLRRLLREGMHPPVRAEEAGSVAAVCTVAERFGLPVAIKPGGSRARRADTAVVRDRAELAAWTRQAGSGTHVVEELLVGPLFRVETLSLGGMHHVVGVERRETPGAVRREDHRQREHSPADEIPGIRSCVRELLDLAGFMTGVLRIDTVLTRDGPRIAGCADGWV
ncbi:hypothetical protein [Streptomyces sp. UG1]|uniref:hypothetical protein n=1 Tax=Streptomyces sp. UG1 TaxID=3417652 RepID=UPI003CED6A3C